MSSKAAPKPARVLVVDDEASVLTTYRLILEQQGYSVTASLSSEEAKKAIAKQTFDLVLCDYSLEQQHTGFEVIAAARARDPKVPSVLLTGYATVETAEEARKKQIGVLFKPIDIKEFLSTISSMLRNNNEPQEAAG
jgi:DNA-binding NtrC family response regulator